MIIIKKKTLLSTENLSLTWLKIINNQSKFKQRLLKDTLYHEGTAKCQIFSFFLNLLDQYCYCNSIFLKEKWKIITAYW